jgi:hypothetical protein
MTRWPVTGSEQTLVDPTGRQVRLLELSPDTEGPMQLFKFSYAACVVPGRARGVGGPRNVWSIGPVAAGSEPVGTTLHVLELRGTAAKATATRSDVETLMDAWAGSSSSAARRPVGASRKRI